MEKYTGFVDYSENINLPSNPVESQSKAILACSIISTIFCFTCIICKFNNFQKSCTFTILSIIVLIANLSSNVVLNTKYKNFVLDKYDIQYGINVTSSISVATHDCYYIPSCKCSSVAGLIPCANITSFGSYNCSINTICCAQYKQVCVAQYRKADSCTEVCTMPLQSQNCQYVYTQCKTTTVLNNVYSNSTKPLASYSLTEQHTIDSPYMPTNTTRNITFAPWSFDITSFPPKQDNSRATILFIIVFGWPAINAAIFLFVKKCIPDVQYFTA